MSIDALRKTLQTGTPAALDALMDDESVVFWVDWREEDDAIVRYCEQILQTGHLDAEIVEIEAEPGFELYIVFRGERHRVPLVIGAEDRHITLYSLNRVLAPEYEIRFCVASNGSDTLAVIPLRADDWHSLESQFGNKVQQHFMAIAEKPNLFTDPICPPSDGSRKWWQF